MNKTLALLILGFVLIFSNGSHGQPNKGDDELVNYSGVGDLKMVFEPGLIIGKEKVRKTFQPSFVVTAKGTLLVFCQGRLKFGGDNDPKVILMNKSYDLGKTWEGVEVLSEPMNFFAISPYSSIIDGKERISFLTCVGLKVTKKYYDNDFEKIHVKTGIDIRKVGVDKAAVLCRYYSDDDGKRWNKEFLTNERTPLYKNYKDFTPVFLNTIGQVHKIESGNFEGRMILAAPIYSVADGDTITDNFRNHVCTGSGVIFSDDDGETWQMEGIINDYLGNEASAVSIENGNAILMIRRLNKMQKFEKYLSEDIELPEVNERIAHKSYDGGKTWTEPFFIPVSEIQCHGTLAKVNDRIYFSIPTGREDRSEKMKLWDEDRVRGAIYFSDDNGENWGHKIIEEDYFSYSTVGQLTGKYMITFFSRGGHGRFGIGYRVFTDSWLEKE